MKKIVITGGIGSGKSVVSSILREHGFPVYGSDENAKRIMNESEEIRIALISRFGEEVYDDKRLNRKYLAEKIFSDDDNRQYVEKNVHSAVIWDFMQWSEQQKSDLVFIESALLYKSDLINSIDCIIQVDAPIEIRIKRTIKRDSVSRDKVIERIVAQEDEIKNIEREQTHSKIRIDNDGDLNELSYKIGYVVGMLKVRMKIDGENTDQEIERPMDF